MKRPITLMTSVAVLFLVTSIHAQATTTTVERDAAREAIQAQIATTDSINGPNYAKTNAMVQLGEAGLKRYRGERQQPISTQKEQDDSNVQKIVMKPHYSSVEQQIWEEFTYPESRFAR